MKKLFINTTGLVAIALLFSGCYLKSVHPLIPANQSEKVFDLDAQWESEDMRWTFISKHSELKKIRSLRDTPIFRNEEIQLEKNNYVIVFENLQDLGSDTLFFYGRTKKFGDSYFLDMSLVSRDNESTFEKAHLFPVHTFSKIDVEEDLLTLNFFEHDKVRELIMSNRVRLKHERVDEEILVTAPTKELQQFILKYGMDNESFDDPIGLKRVQK